MRIEGEDAGRSIREVWLQLTRVEAERLKVVLDHMVGPDADLDPEWHAHVEGDDGQSVIAIGWDLR
jgi:hypothetical protein